MSISIQSWLDNDISQVTLKMDLILRFMEGATHFEIALNYYVEMGIVYFRDILPILLSAELADAAIQIFNWLGLPAYFEEGVLRWLAS